MINELESKKRTISFFLRLRSYFDVVVVLKSSLRNFPKKKLDSISMELFLFSYTQVLWHIFQLFLSSFSSTQSHKNTTKLSWTLFLGEIDSLTHTQEIVENLIFLLLLFCDLCSFIKRLFLSRFLANLRLSQPSSLIVK